MGSVFPSPLCFCTFFGTLFAHVIFTIFLTLKKFRLKLCNLVKCVKFGQNCKFGQYCEIWSKMCCLYGMYCEKLSVGSWRLYVGSGRGYLSNFATGFQKFHFFCKYIKNNDFQVPFWFGF